MSNPFTSEPLHVSRRDMLSRCSSGFGLLALSALTRQLTASNGSVPLPSVAPKAKNVVLCYMSGGVSQIDSFDPKPKLEELHGKPMPVKVERTQFNNNGNVFASPFKFKRWGQSGLEVSSMFPKLAEWCADDLAVIRSMTTPVNEHAQANYHFHSGFPFIGHPSAGAWISYGLGADTQDLPSFVVLQSGGAVPPHGGIGLFSNGFLPANHQASVLKVDQTPATANIRPWESVSSQRQRLDALQDLDRLFRDRTGGDPDIEAAAMNYETAFRMQAAVPELTDISGESEAVKKLYGIHDPHRQKAAYAKQCLLARRLIERGVRFVELSCLTQGIGAGGAANPWDQHGDLERGHGEMAYQVDQPMAALLTDLKARGLLDETIVVWAGEFGRTPFSQGSNGRDHNPFGFSVWLAGGGVSGGQTYGATDELGYHVVDKPTNVYELWATVLHLLGVDYEALTHRHGGRDMRLTDVHGKVLRELIA